VCRVLTNHNRFFGHYGVKPSRLRYSRGYNIRHKQYGIFGRDSSKIPSALVFQCIYKQLTACLRFRNQHSYRIG
jgi:hypothetical protein